MHLENANVGAAVEACLPNIAKAIDLVGPRVARGGRVIYLGAGPGGRYANFPFAKGRGNKKKRHELYQTQHANLRHQIRHPRSSRSVSELHLNVP